MPDRRTDEGQADWPDPDTQWDQAEDVLERMHDEHRYPLHGRTADVERDEPDMSYPEFLTHLIAIERALPRMTDMQVMLLTSSLGWERDIRNWNDVVDPPDERRWRPWSELRRRTHLQFRWSSEIDASRIGAPRAYGVTAKWGGLPGPDGDGWLHLKWGASNLCLSHELTHDDRGVVVDVDDDTRRLEEDVVDAIAAERMRSYRHRWWPAPSLARVRGEQEHAR